jgi:tRNA G18 (ribose-2'-O)-methylase SpoU
VRPLRITKPNSTFQIIQALKENRTKRAELGEVFVEGITPIKNALRAGKSIKRIIYTTHEALSDWSRKLLLAHENAQLISLETTLFDTLSDKSDPSELLVTIVKEDAKLEQMLVPRDPFVVVLDRPGNHGNLGSIVRSANAFGADLIIISGHGVDPFDPTAIRASTGAIFFTKVCHAESVEQLREWIATARTRHAGLTVLGTDSESDVSLAEYSPIRRPVVLLIGNEAKGLSVRLKSLADRMIRIPMNGEVDSLNVACAASIVMYEISRASEGTQRRQTDVRAQE